MRIQAVSYRTNFVTASSCRYDATAVNSEQSIELTSIQAGGVAYLGARNAHGVSSSNAPAAMAIMSRPNEISITSYLSETTNPAFAGFADLQYSDVSDALASLASDEAPIDWRINAAVYSTSLQVAAILSEKAIPAPSVFSNDAESVVFNWSADDKALYLTITNDQVWLLCSDKERIRYRGELTERCAPVGFIEFVDGLKHESRLMPGKIAE